MTPRRLVLSGVLVGASLACATGAAADRQRDLHDLLMRPLRFNQKQVASVRRGESVVVDLPAPVARQIGVAGAVRIAAPASRTVDLVRDVERLERGKGFLQTKKMSEPPALADFATFDLPAEDVAALRKCRPGDCDVKLGLSALREFQAIDWTARDATERAREMMRRHAVAYVERYRRGGNAELAVYRDAERPTSVAREFAALVNDTAGLAAAFPEVSRYLLDHPQGRPSGVEDFYYWSLADFGFKPVFRINHVVIRDIGSATGLLYAITTKQLYASHYFHTALEVRALVDDAEAPGRGHYLIVLNLARSDGLTGLFGGIVRARARRGARDALHGVLATMKARAEGRVPRPVSQ